MNQSKEPVFLNSIELKGIVGQSAVNRISDTRVCRFSVCVENCFTDRSGTPVVECVWFNVTAWEGKNIAQLESITKNVNIHVKGRVRSYRYTTADGIERCGWEVFAKEVKVLNA